MPISDIALLDSVRFIPTEFVVRTRSVVAFDALLVADLLVPLYGLVIRERLRVRDAASQNTLGNATVSDALRLTALLYSARDVALEDVLRVEQTEAFQRALRIIEALRLSESLVGNGAYNLSLVHSLRLVDSLTNFFGADVVEDLQLTPNHFARVLALAEAEEGLVIEATLSPQFLVSAVARDGIELTSDQAIQMLFNPTLIDGVEIAAGMLEPNGSFTTWVMNTRTGAVTEYGNFAFNSFAGLGNKYLAASDDGLFELSGDDDEGEEIVARVKGGFMQFGGTQLSRLKEAYIAARGEGRYVLKVRTADGAVYNYGVDTRDGRSTKVHMGKGQRARYFAYEMISAGQDFDLDTIEFVPLVVQRRV